MASGRVGIQVAPDKAELCYAAFEFFDARLRLHARRLWKHADADKIIRIKPADAMDQIIAQARPIRTGFGGSDMMRHRGRARRKDRQIRPTLTLEL